jgi:hypothetical protein
MIPQNLSQEKFTTTQEEISHLTQNAERGHILQSPGFETRENALRETVRNYALAEAKDFLHDTRVLPAHESERIILKLKPEMHDQKMEELFGVMMERGIKNALDVVEKMNDPHLTDDFHRFLVQYLHTIGALPSLKPAQELYKTIDHALFVVSLPAKADEIDFKKFIAAMKQFYQGMQAATLEDNHYTLELAVEHHGPGIALFASIPRSAIDTFQKLVHAYYPDASIEEAVDDYNVFAPSAASIVGAVAALKEPAIFPLATDETLAHDPLAALIGSLSQFAADGEGAAIQFTFASDSSNKLFDSAITQAEKTRGSVKKIYKELTESVLASVGKSLLSFFDTPKKEEEKTEFSPADARELELAKAKNKSQTFRAVIRIVASAQTLSRAQSLLATIKASFHQFTQTGSNAIEWSDIRAGGLTDFCRDFSFRSFDAAHALPLNVDELGALFHFPVGLAGAPELKEASGTTAPAPATIATGGNNSGVYLGQNVHRGQTTDIFLAKEDRVRHCYVIGQTGTGKTTILKNMIIQDIKNGQGCCFIDPHGSDIQDILANIPPERLDDVIYFDPAYTARPMGLNMLEYDPNFPEQKTFVVNELLAIFNKLFDMKVAGGPMFEQYFRNSALLVMEDPASGSTLLEIGRVLSDKAFRDMKLERCTNPIIKQFWINAEKTSGEASLANFVPYITNKFDVFISNDIMRPVIAQQKSVLNFRDIMDNKKILLVNLSKGRLGDINSHLIGLILVGKLTMAALSRVDQVGRTTLSDFYLYIDEFQIVTTDSIAKILSEARKYRLALTMAHQYIEQLEENIKNAVFGNVGNMIIYRVSPENANVFEKQLAPTFTPDDILKLQNFQAYAKLLVHGVPEKPFNLRIPPPPQGNLELSDKVKELSYMRYGRPRAEVEAEILARYN